jgi:hypothetical protein
MKKTTKTKTAAQKKRAIVMKEFKKGELRSGSGALVSNPKQAVAIAYSEGRNAKKKNK